MKRRPPAAAAEADHLGTFTKLALDIEKCQRYNPSLWDVVLNRSNKSLEKFAKASTTKTRKRARGPSSSSTPTTFPAVNTSTAPLTLSSYLHQPDMVREMLLELQPEHPAEVLPENRSRSTMPMDKPPPIPRPSPPIPSITPTPSPTKLPILNVVTPRTRQWIGRLPPPREADWAAINQLESVADDAVARRANVIDNLHKPHSLYGKLHHHRKSPRKDGRSDSRRRRDAASRYAADTSPTNSTVTKSIQVANASRLRMDQETALMHQEDHHHTPPLTTSFDDERQRVATEVTTLVEGIGSPQAKYPLHQPHHVALETDHRVSVLLSESTGKAHQDATAAVDATLASIQKLVPLELIYAHGQGRYASMQIQRAMSMVHQALLRLVKRQFVVAWSRWQQHTCHARERERRQAVIVIQCAWRRVLARREVHIRRGLRRKQEEREKYLLRMLLARQNDAAACITRHLRRYVAVCHARKERKRNVAALRIQRFIRRRHGLWARFARFLQHQRDMHAATCIQKHIRAHLARAKTRLVRKLRAVDRRRALLTAHLEARAHALRLVGAALTVQRNFRRRQVARRAKFGAMRRRHAKKVVAAVKVQSIARMYLARRLRCHMQTTFAKAALVIQCAFRRHCSLSQRQQRKQVVADDRKRRISKKKELRREKKQRQKAKAKANQATKMWMALQDTASTVNKTRLKWMQMEPPQAATVIQGVWKGFKTRQRLKRQVAKDKERARRQSNSAKRLAATCIQRHVRGMLGRRRFWVALVNRFASSIQRLFRNRKARRDIALMRAYVKAARLIQSRWIHKKEFVVFRRRRRAAVAIQSIARMFIATRRYVQRMQAFHRQLELRVVGQVLFAQRTLDVVQTQLLQLSWQYATESKKHLPPPQQQPGGANVQRSLYKRSDNGTWTTTGCFGLWQKIYLDICRHGNTSDAVEIDNMRFSRFVKEIPGMLHKSLCPLQNVDVAFAKFKPAKGRTMPFSGFHKAMSYLLTLRYPDKPPNQYTMEQRFLLFMHQLVLVSKFGEVYRLALATSAMERGGWAAHVIQSMYRHRQQQRQHQAFVARFLVLRRQDEERRAATLLQTKWRQRLATLQFQSLVCDTFVEYVDWKSGACSYKNLVTHTTTYSRPALLRGLTPSVSIKLPPPGEEFVVLCCRHETQPRQLATTFCLACEDAMCSDCFDREHKAKAFAAHTTTRIRMCHLCSKHTASRVCNQCQDGNVPYCDTCYPHYHKGKFAGHTFTALVFLCVECGDRVGRWRCATCTDLFCKKCFSNFHRKGQRQNHVMEAVSYLAVEAKSAQDVRLHEKELEQAEALRALDVSRQVAAIELQKQEIAALLIQTAYRAKRGRVEGQAYMKAVRHTNRMVYQRLKDDSVRSAFTYKLRKVVGMAPVLASDTIEEVQAVQLRKDKIVNALGLATYDHTKGPPPWCQYNVPVEILVGDFKSCVATVVSTAQVVASGLVMVHVTAANKSVTLPLAALKPLGDNASPSKVLQLVDTVGNAAHKLQVSLLDRIEKKRHNLKLRHHRTEFKDLEEYAWVELPREPVSPPANDNAAASPRQHNVATKTTWWNVVTNSTRNRLPFEPPIWLLS
ncbi:hypothetical protein, variant 1 [Aphanomyces astaci]|uniref:B box-type domain-containing protein n=1 Tax=Aphanomyces astaci TaxID=112090 RepID=W4H4Z7_APHAT|nr:hypothetical protein, variant 1 [Aphanomyces astaci]ETV87055.1 hypothetical protein, variant 1 [Aphanomyces astaci]|eukprot:XP_009823855.1 hypothetical protein, variant 1 [Aphanomyces astaci]